MFQENFRRATTTETSTLRIVVVLSSATGQLISIPIKRSHPLVTKSIWRHSGACYQPRRQHVFSYWIFRVYTYSRAVWMNSIPPVSLFCTITMKLPWARRGRTTSEQERQWGMAQKCRVHIRLQTFRQLSIHWGIEGWRDHHPMFSVTQSLDIQAFPFGFVKGTTFPVHYFRLFFCNWKRICLTGNIK